MKRQKPNFIRDWADEFSRLEKIFQRRLERLIWKRNIVKGMKDEKNNDIQISYRR